MLADLALHSAARPTNGGGITIVGIDTRNVGRNIVGLKVLNNHLAGRLLLVVGACMVKEVSDFALLRENRKEKAGGKSFNLQSPQAL